MTDVRMETLMYTSETGKLRTSWTSQTSQTEIGL